MHGYLSILRRHRNEVDFLAVTALLATTNFVAFYPGLMTSDSMNQLRQARTGVYNDHHPPVMSFVWHLLLPLQDGPMPMLLFHLVMFWGAIAILALTMSRKCPRFGYLFPVLWFIPPVMGMTGAIWKDTGLATSWLMVVALSVRYHVLARRPPVIASVTLLACFLYGLAVRYNAVTGAWPIAFLIVRVHTTHVRPPSLLRSGIYALALTGVAYAATVSANHSLTSQKKFLEQAVFLQDLTCISDRIGQPLFPKSILDGTPISFDELLKEYHARERYPWPNGFYADDPERVSTTRAYWLQTILRFPLDYIACRTQIFNMILRIGREPSYAYQLPDQRPRSDDGSFELSKGIVDMVSNYLDAMSDREVNKPWIWAILGMLLLVANAYCQKHPQASTMRLAVPVICILSSGLLYMMLYLFIAIGPDVRFVYWSILAFSVAFVMSLCIIESWGDRDVDGTIARDR